LTVEEVRDIIITMRKSESLGEALFSKSNSRLPEKDKTFERFTEELNKTFDKYDINTCLRRIHFLAQIYHETDRLRTTREYSTSGKYAPYIGRGLMQLTWIENYQMYKSYSGVECVRNYEVIANNLTNAFDSAGWFWKQGKTLNVGTTWAAPSSAPSYVRRHSPRYPKTIYTFTGKNGQSKRYGTIDMNLIADDDYVDVISWLVNGGSNGLSERRLYVEKLKKVFEYDTNCQNEN